MIFYPLNLYLPCGLPGHPIFLEEAQETASSTMAINSKTPKEKFFIFQIY